MPGWAQLRAVSWHDVVELCAGRSREQDDLAAEATGGEAGKRFADLRQRVCRGDGQLQLAGPDQAREIGQHGGAPSGGVPLGLDAVLVDGVEPGEPVEPGWRDPEL